MCVREYNLGNNNKRDDVFSGTPDSWYARFQILRCSADRNRAIMIIDVSVAFMHAEAEDEIICKVPAGKKQANPTGYWRLKKALNGTRKASQSFQKFSCEHLVSWGFKQNDHNAAIFYNSTTDVSNEEHGDDFLVDGPRDELIKLQDSFHKAFVIKKINLISSAERRQGRLVFASANKCF